MAVNQQNNALPTQPTSSGSVQQQHIGSGLLKIEENPHSHSITIKIPKKFCGDALSPNNVNGCNRSEVDNTSTTQIIKKQRKHKLPKSHGGKTSKRTKGHPAQNCATTAADDAKEKPIKGIFDRLHDVNLQPSDEDSRDSSAHAVVRAAATTG